MCGIAGLVERPGESPPQATLEAMGAALAHRGPDDARIETYGRAGLSFRRLSIIDVAGGAQPIHNEDRTCHVILNGEIYNHLDLRAELEGRGHRFLTRSDVESVVHGYEEWGEALPERLAGMFAFALWDARRQRLFLARDRLGKKPLYYHLGRERLLFGSEIKSLLCDENVPRDLDDEALDLYLSARYVPAAVLAVQRLRASGDVDDRQSAK